VQVRGDPSGSSLYTFLLLIAFLLYSVSIVKCVGVLVLICISLYCLRLPSSATLSSRDDRAWFRAGGQGGQLYAALCHQFPTGRNISSHRPPDSKEARY
jgi:hypothetical protein